MGQPSDTTHPMTRCGCGKQLDAAMGDPGTEPTPGDLTLCAYCGQLMQFGADLTPAPVEIGAVKGLEPMQRAKILRMQAAIRERRPN